MTSILLEAVGLCAHESKQGDWAFDLAFHLAQERNIQLNVFHFLQDPYGEERTDLRAKTRKEINEVIAEREKRLRFYYDDKLGEHLKAGFRVCEGKEWTELRRCLIKREFQIIVVPYLEEGTRFGGHPIEEFAHHFGAPMLLVGPHNPDEIRLNQPARMIADQLLLPFSTEQVIGAEQGAH